jgi:hypothetical protein
MHVRKGDVPKYRGTFSGLLLIAREEGVGALYKGFIPKVHAVAAWSNAGRAPCAWRRHPPDRGRGASPARALTQWVSDQARRFLGPPYI